jgi:hypothetical protein
MERYRRFIGEAVRADEAMQQSGLGYEAGEVHAYVELKARGLATRRPAAVRWRR